MIATIPVSVRFQGDARALQEVTVDFASLSRTVRVLDFLPKTTTVTDVVGPIRIETTTEKGGDSKVRFEAETTARGELGSVAELQGSVNAGADVNISYRELTTISYEQLPPQQMIIASGIRNRGHGVFFKLKPNEQHPVEGQRNFVCLLEVDLGWRKDRIADQLQQHETERRHQAFRSLIDSFVLFVSFVVIGYCRT